MASQQVNPKNKDTLRDMLTHADTNAEADEEDLDDSAKDKDYLAVQATSCAVERTFSTSGNTVTSRTVNVKEC